MKIYRISGSFDGGIHAHFTRTKAEAEAYIHSFSESDAFVELEIEIEYIEPTRAGIARFLNDFIMEVALNEGG